MGIRRPVDAEDSTLRIGEKVDYVRREMQQPAGDHHCHWPGCPKKVPAALWGCREHWRLLPRRIRNWIWNTYIPGQEIKKSPTKAYLQAAKAAQEWINDYLEAQRQPKKKKKGPKHG